MFRFFCVLIFLPLTLISCFHLRTFDPIHEDLILESSQPQPPKWIYQSYVEARNQFYFVNYVRSEFHMPSLAYNLVRRDLHDFFVKEADYILQPILKNISKSRFYAFRQEFKVFLSQELMVSIRNSRIIYWEKVSYQQNSISKSGYWYYVLLSLPKQTLRLIQQRFILKKLEFARNNRKTLLIKELEACLEVINTLRENDSLRQSKFPKDYKFDVN
ncbi:hypothetical protein DID74_02495 [Candidatus Marinamargulisbacteria bacterium SCGC AG-333-B06]|nr:hypothetical protein DID74_02495 [Candidatus Marinamargulisbacteria bacterium SCGC AG-333-B06]